MAVPAQLFQAASVKGNREDLIDKIFQVSPTETPITSAAGKVTATSVFHEWQVDSLAAPVSTNAAIDGDDATLQSQTATQRLGNHCQILTKVIGVSRRANLIKKAGRGMELGYLKAKAKWAAWRCNVLLTHHTVLAVLLLLGLLALQLLRLHLVPVAH
jgi:hypothetical protein